MLLCLAALAVGAAPGLQRPACRSDAATTSCPYELAVFDRGDRDFWHKDFGVTWKNFPTTDPGYFFRAMGLSAAQAARVGTAELLTQEMIRLWEASGSLLGSIDLRDSESGALKKEFKAQHLKVESVAPSLADGMSYVFRLEEFSGGWDRPDLIMSPLFGLYHETSRLTGFVSTGHVYVAGKEGARTLTPHTDPYDVFVFQLLGSKNWTVCTPQDPALDAMNLDFTDADRYIRQEQIMHASSFGEVQKSSLYTEAEIADQGMRCSKFVLRAGESAYLPKGAIHFAVATAEPSVHFTSSLIRNGGCWGDLFRYFAAELPTSISPTATEPDGSRSLDHAEAAGNGLYDALAIAEKQPYALAFMRPLPFMHRIMAGELDVVDIAVLLHEVDGLLALISATLESFFGDGAPRGMSLGIAFATNKLNLAKHIRGFATKLRIGYMKLISDPGARAARLNEAADGHDLYNDPGGSTLGLVEGDNYRGQDELYGM
jgi:hypothetical protein